jgi:NRPS condensation-like uncharacterized protein
MRRSRAVQYAPITPQDQMFIDLDRAGEPWNAYMELWVSGHLDAERLASAARAAMDRHPIARARLAKASERAGPQWEIPDRVDRVPLDVRDCPDEAALREARADPLNAAPRLDVSPPFELVLAHSPQGDVLIMNLHHAIGDGIAAFRLVNSICRAYAGLDDPLPDLDQLAARDLRSVASRKRTLVGRLSRLRWHFQQFAEASGPPARVVPSVRQPVGWKSGIHLLRLDRDETDRLRGRRIPPATLNDLLLGAVAVTIRCWNESRGVSPSRVALKAPMNIRPPEWTREVMGNLAAALLVSVPADAQVDLDAAQVAVSDSMRGLKGQPHAEILAHGGVLPVRIKRLLKTPIARAGERRDTAIFSNMGPLDLPRDLHDGGPVRGFWVTTTVRNPRGLTLVVLSVHGELFLSIHYGKELLDAESAAEFASLLKTTLLEPV